MQIIFLPNWLTILSFIIIWPMIQVLISMVGNWIPDKYFNADSFWYRTHRCENGSRFYEKVLRIKLWKRWLPDGAKAFKVGFAKGELKETDEAYLKAFIAETCRAEFVHTIQILPFWVFGLWAPAFVIWIMLGYALMANLPCIIAQRYNRPRLKKLYTALYMKKGDIDGEYSET